MVSSTDEGRGLVKVYWSEVRKRVEKVEPTFAKIVDELDPDKSFPLYLAYYPYGMLIADTQSPFIPMPDGTSFRLTDPNAPRDIIKNLGYGKDSLPLGMVLDKELEYFIDLKNENITIPWSMHVPGNFFPFARILSKKNNRIYSPNGVLSTMSGARSTFMLPNIGCLTNHVNLQRDFNIQLPPPKSLYSHWQIFKEIINSKEVQSNWSACLIYFSENWVNKIANDKKWLALKLYLHELAWEAFEFERNQIYYNISFSLIQKKCNLKPNPYLVDTAKHLFTIAIGAAPGYIPASTEQSLPLKTLQKAFVESYGIKKYIPTIMHPITYHFETQSIPVYYSLQNPSTFVFSPKARKLSSTLFEMRELEHIMRVFLNELKKDNAICSDTILGKLSSNVEFSYFHNEKDYHNIIKPSIDILQKDKSFRFTHAKIKGMKLAEDAKFLRGCIAINAKC